VRAVTAAPYPPIVRRIVDLLDDGAIADALAIATNAIANANARDAALLHCVHANALVIRGDAIPAFRLADAAYRDAEKLNDPLVVCEAKLSLAFALQALDKHAIAIDLATDCEQIGNAHGDTEMVARSWRTMGISMSVLGRHAVAIDYLQRSLDLFRKKSYAKTRVLHAQYSLLNARSRAMPPETTDGACEKFAALHDDWESFTSVVAMENNARLHAMALGNAAIAASRAGRKVRALEQLRLALALQTRMQLHAHCAMTECHVGAVLAELDRTDEALDAYARGIALFQTGNPRSFANALEAYSILLEKTGRISEALKALRRSRDVEKTLGDSAGHLAVSRIERDNEIAMLSTKWLRLAEEDALTRLPNRRAFDRRLSELVSSASYRNQFFLAFLDIDFFKRINDSLGHDIGDRVLKQVASAIRLQTPKTAFAARIGGEEFAILLLTQDREDAVAHTNALIGAIRDVAWTQIAPSLSVTASAGLVGSHEVSETIDASETVSLSTLMRRADERLYRAKRDGRDRVCSQ
jgi:diguanylate cyclase (GGDEF)-like protein